MVNYPLVLVDLKQCEVIRAQVQRAEIYEPCVVLNLTSVLVDFLSPEAEGLYNWNGSAVLSFVQWNTEVISDTRWFIGQFHSSSNNPHIKPFIRAKLVEGVNRQINMYHEGCVVGTGLIKPLMDRPSKMAHLGGYRLAWYGVLELLGTLAKGI